MIKIRLKKTGTKSRKQWRVVVVDHRTPRNGRLIEELGFYNPLIEPPSFGSMRSATGLGSEKGPNRVKRSRLSSEKESHQEMRIDLITLFPEFFHWPWGHSLLKRARSKGKVEFHLHNPRDFTTDRHRTVDEKPFGGGAGMVLKPEPIFRCVKTITQKRGTGFVILLSPRGEPFTQGLARRLARKKHLILICGHYEGVDERVSKELVDQEISVGDFVTMGGEAPALCLIEAVVRLIPGVLGNPESLKEESFSNPRNGASGTGLEPPQYTRPRVFRGHPVPAILLSGNHRAIEAWRREESRRVTLRNRPDLLKGGDRS